MFCVEIKLFNSVVYVQENKIKYVFYFIAAFMLF